MFLFLCLIWVDRGLFLPDATHPNSSLQFIYITVTQRPAHITYVHREMCTGTTFPFKYTKRLNFDFMFDKYWKEETNHEVNSLTYICLYRFKLTFYLECHAPRLDVYPNIIFVNLSSMFWTSNKRFGIT